MSESFYRLWNFSESIPINHKLIPVPNGIEVPWTTTELSKEAQKAIKLSHTSLSKRAILLGSLEGKLIENTFQNTRERNISNAFLERIRKAKNRIDIVSAYFLIDDFSEYGFPELSHIYDALFNAVKRGVTVNIYTNSIKSTDLFMVNLVSYAGYRKIIESGISIFELSADHVDSVTESKQPGQGSLHSKVAIFDDDWIIIGSFNLDGRSHIFDTNNDLILHDPEGKANGARYLRELSIYRNETPNPLRWQRVEIQNIESIIKDREREIEIFKMFKDMI